MNAPLFSYHNGRTIEPAKRLSSARGGRSLRPCWSTYYRLGVELQRSLPVYATLGQVASEIGTTSQTAYTETVVALGKVVWLMKYDPEGNDL